MNKSVEILIAIIESKIKELIQNIDANSVENNKIDKYSTVIDMLKTNPFVINEPAFETTVEELLQSISDKEKLSEVLSQLTNFIVVAEGYKKGFIKELRSDEIGWINNIISVLSEARENEEIDKRKRLNTITENNDLKLKYSMIYDKLIAGKNGTEHFKDEEIDTIIDLLKNEAMENKMEVLEYIRQISNNISENILMEVEQDDYQKDKNVIAIDDGVLKELFEKYGYEYEKMPDTYKQSLQTKGSLKNILELLEFINKTGELSFLKGYGSTKYEVKENSRLKKEFKDLYFIFRYATVETLKYLIEDSQKLDLPMQYIFRIDGVYKHVSKGSSVPSIPGGGPSDSLNLIGCFEYYVRNKELLNDLSRECRIKYDDDSIDLFKSTVLVCPTVLKTSTEVLKRNIEIARMYNVELIKKDGETYVLKCPTSFMPRKFLERLDSLIEFPALAQYVHRYPSILLDESFMIKVIAAAQKGELNFDINYKLKGIPRGKHSLPTIDRSFIENVESLIHPKLKEAAKNSDVVSYFRKDEVTESLNEYVENESKYQYASLCYNINGVFVSNLKFKRVWTSMMSEYDKLPEEEKLRIEKKDLLLYALTFGSYHTEEDFRKLEKFTNEFDFGGPKNGVFNGIKH